MPDLQKQRRLQRRDERSRFERIKIPRKCVKSHIHTYEQPPALHNPGRKKHIEAYFNYIYGRLRRMLLRQNRGSDLSSPKLTLTQITTDTHLRNAIAYANRNGYVTNPYVTPFSYEWGAARYFFNSTHANEEKKFIKEMYNREKMKFFHTHDIDFPDNYYLTNGYISPLCYCKIEECETLYKNAHQYCWLITRNVESFKEIADQVGDKIFYTDEELYTAMLQHLKQNRKNPDRQTPALQLQRLKPPNIPHAETTRIPP